MSSGSGVHIFGYLDYRAFLRDFYRAEKERGTNFSFRAFAQRAKIRSYNYLHLVMKGERELSATMAAKFARGCGLDANESAYFCELVAFGQAKSAEERNRAYERLTRFRAFRAAHRLEPAQAAYHEHWYVPAIRELICLPDFRDDPKWIAERLSPRISPAQAKGAIETLLTLGLVVRNAQGNLAQVDSLVTTGEGPLGHHVANYHRAMIAQALSALDEVPRGQRDVSSITLSVSEPALVALKTAIADFRKQLLELADAYGAPDRVIQLNIQLFPLSSSKARTK